MIQTLAHDFLDVESESGFDVPSSAHAVLDDFIREAAGRVHEKTRLSEEGFLLLQFGHLSNLLLDAFSDNDFEYEENGLLSHALETKKMDCKGYSVLSYSVFEEVWNNLVADLSWPKRLERRLFPHKYQRFPLSIAVEPNHVFLIGDIGPYLFDWETLPGDLNGIVEMGSRERYCMKKFDRERAKLLAYLSCGNVKHDQGDFKAAISLYEKARQLCLSYGRSYSNLASAYLGLGGKLNQQKALEIVEAGMKVDKRSPNLLSAHSNLLSHEGNLEEALKEIDKAITLHPSNAGFYFDKAHLHYRNSELDKGIAECDKAILLKPSFAKAYMLRAKLKENAGRKEEAFADYGKYIELRPDDAKGYSRRGYILKLMGRYEEAERDFAKANEIDPGKETQKVRLDDIRRELRKLHRKARSAQEKQPQ